MHLDIFVFRDCSVWQTCRHDWRGFYGGVRVVGLLLVDSIRIFGRRLGGVDGCSVSFGGCSIVLIFLLG